MSWRPPDSSGSACKEGKLYLFSAKEIVVLATPWRNPRAWRKSERWPHWVAYAPRLPRAMLLRGRCGRRQVSPPSTPLSLVDGDGQLQLFPYRPHRSRRQRLVANWERFLEPLPPPVRQLMVGYRSLEKEWPLLSFLARTGSGALDLACSNPGLAACMAFNWNFVCPKPGRPHRANRRRIARSQRDIAAWLGFPSPPRAVRLLRRFPPKLVRVVDCAYLRDLLWEEGVGDRLAHHAPVIHRGVLGLMNRHALPWVGGALVEEVAYCEEEQRNSLTSRQLRDCVTMMRHLGRAPRQLPTFRRRRRVREVHDELLEETLGPQQARWLGAQGSFPEPPLPGNEWCHPLCSAAALVHEGELMEHCVAGYTQRVVTGRSFIYRVEGAGVERCTIELRPRWGVWQLRQACGPKNARVSRETIRKLQRYLERQQVDVVNRRSALRDGGSSRASLAELAVENGYEIPF